MLAYHVQLSHYDNHNCPSARYQTNKTYSKKKQCSRKENIIIIIIKKTNGKITFGLIGPPHVLARCPDDSEWRNARDDDEDPRCNRLNEEELLNKDCRQTLLAVARRTTTRRLPTEISNHPSATTIMPRRRQPTRWKHASWPTYCHN